MLADFQQALADLTASPGLCNRARSDPTILDGRYQLTRREWARLVGIVRHRGMACNCIVYRANRLAPLALNIPRTCKALGPQLRAVVDEFWSAFPETNVHFCRLVLLVRRMDYLSHALRRSASPTSPIFSEAADWPRPGPFLLTNIPSHSLGSHSILRRERMRRRLT
jgi:hypothetical protein